ncbi:MAG: hypothetical protein RIC16_00940 [Rhodospirillales bacterium]
MKPEELKTILEAKNVEYLLPTYVDMHGVSKSKMVPIHHFNRMMSGSELCTGAALDAFEADPLTARVFGPEMHNAWLDFKRQEWLSYMNHVADWERRRYLKFF